MVIVCDCQYRSSITAIRGFAKLGKKVIAVTTDENRNPSAFASRFIYEKHVFSSDKKIYKEQLLNLCKKADMPIVFPSANYTLNVLSENADEFKPYARFLVSSPETLTFFNDKKLVKNKAQGLNIASSARGKGHEEGGSAYAKAGSSLRSPPGNSRASTPQTRVCLLSALCSHLHL